MSRKLHIGGREAAQGWEILNALPGPHVDHLGNANDLSQFEDETFETIYASHLLEHLDYQGEILSALRDWWRVLVPGGELMVAVPDLDVLCQLFLDKENHDLAGRFEIMRMIFGGHLDEFDYHQIGFDLDLLIEYLRVAGFVNFRRTQNFGLFSDTSCAVFNGTPISLNIIAQKAVETDPELT